MYKESPPCEIDTRVLAAPPQAVSGSGARKLITRVDSEKGIGEPGVSVS